MQSLRKEEKRSTRKVLEMKNREIYIKELLKEDLSINLNALEDVPLKQLHKKYARFRQSRFPYHVVKGVSFEEALKTHTLQFVSFRNTPNVRPLTFKEYMELERYTNENDNYYKNHLL